jgi:hypothetical protein
VADRKANRRGGDAAGREISFQQNGSPNSETADATQAQTSYAVTSGRVALGSITLTAAGFVAIDSDGKTVGRFRTLREAMRAFPRERAP